MTVVTNTSPIIILAKIKRLQLLKELYGTVIMSPFVKVECIDRGKEVGARDVVEIENGIRQGWIQPVSLERNQMREVKSLMDEARIGFGEAEALVLAKNKDALVVLDDKEARAIAKSWDLEYTSTIMVLYEAFEKGLINYDELVEDLTKLTKIIWISTDVITEIIKKAMKVRK